MKRTTLAALCAAVALPLAAGGIGAATGVPTLAEVLGSGSSAANQRIHDVLSPATPGDAANKAYVDGKLGVQTRQVWASAVGVVIPSQNQEYLPFDYALSGGGVLNNADVEEPTLSGPSGVYAASVWLQPRENMTPGATYEAYLVFDQDGEDEIERLTSAPATVLAPQPKLIIPLTWYLTKGAEVYVTVINGDTVPRRFALEGAAFQRIS